jgi:hypothetical protein
LLSIIARLHADTVAGACACALVGAALVAVFQGPAPALVLVLVVAQTTGEWDLRTGLATLSGSGLGAAVGALVVASTAGRNRSLARLHLVFGALSTLLVLISLDLWVALSDRLVAGPPEELRWGKRVLMPNMTGHLAVAFALSQVAVAIALVPFVPHVVRWFEARWSAKEAPAVA